MTASHRDAFAALRLDWARTPEDVWRTSAVHVEGLHVDAARGIEAGMADAIASSGSSPIGVVVQGQRGSGKTHLLGWVRERVHSLGGYFFLVGPLSGTSFWESVAGSMVENLLRDVDGHGSQLAVFLRRCSALFGVSDVVRAGVVGDTDLAPEHLKDFIVGLRQYDRRLGSDCQDTLRAMVLYGAADYVAQDVGQCYLQSMEEQEPGERAHRGMRTPAKPAHQIVKEMSQLLALTGPSVIAIDQIDTVIAESMSSVRQLDDGPGDQQTATLFDQIADGLLVLRDITARTLCVVSCLPTTWVLIEKYAVATVSDRFRELTALNRIGTPEIGRQLVEKRFADCFRTIYFRAPYPTWPVQAAAFDDAAQYTPRNLIQRIDRHVQDCLAAGRFVELEKFQPAEVDYTVVPDPPICLPPDPESAAFDERFDELRRAAEIGDILVPEKEDVAVPRLLAAGLTAWIAERGLDRDVFSQDPLPGRKPVLHARLRQALDDDAGDEIHWAFRAISSDQAISALNRIRAAATKAGIEQSRGKRRLYLLRNTEWSRGARTQEAIEAFTAAGGVTLALTDDDLRTFSALERMLAEKRPHLQDWLLARRPASGTALLRTALPAAEAPTAAMATPTTATVGLAGSDTGRAPAGTPTAAGAGAGHPEIRRITIGRAVTDQAEARVDLESLRRHTVIFAGSGSGKTVLIRRLVEECALQGVSSVVLDPNNDLARLGDAWPHPPAQWAAGDADLAAKYLAETDVVVWTPRRTRGRPLTFQPLPDFRGILDDPDELDVAIDAATVTLAARANVAGSGAKATKGQAVLRQALGHFARSERTGLPAFLELLADLPDGVSSLADAWKVAGDLGEALKAVMVIDPLFGGQGEPVDPGVLLTPPAGKRARVSVISLVGLPGDEQRQAFVNQLQMALFAWVKKNPAGDRPLGGLFVMDEAQTFAPSSGSTPCTKSTLALAAQARKYGLGLVFATQAPKGLHNYIPANATTQFFGLLNAPVQIAAAQEMAKAKGGDASDIARLKVGQFYAAGEGVKLRKLQTPLCLSHHPKSPLTAEEVLDRARGGA
jgi:Helicase HerA, central domain